MTGRPETALGNRAACPVCASCEVRSHALCTALNDTEILELAAIATEIRVDPGRAVFREDDAASFVFNITQGTVRLSRLLADGRRQIVGFLSAGDMVGLTFGERYIYAAEAIDAVTLCRFPREKLARLFDRYPKLEWALVNIASNELIAAQDHMVLLGRMTARERLLVFLMSQSDRAALRGLPASPIRLAMVRADIADHLGLTVEHVSRTLRALAAEGLIAFETPSIISLEDPDRIRAEIGG